MRTRCLLTEFIDMEDEHGSTDLYNQLLLSVVLLLELLYLLTELILFLGRFFLQLLNLVFQQPAQR